MRRWAGVAAPFSAPITTISAALTVAVAVASTPVAAQAISVDGGRISGTTAANGVREWRGVPFAAAPVRALRWRAPQPVEPWAGVRAADRYAPQCMQSLRAPSINHYFGAEATSEDCLYLNIWAPPAGQSRRGHLPVVVWIYGGGFTVGSASMPNYSGAAMAARGVVQVNLSYRLGALGFLSHPELSAEADGASGNYGLMDQIAGLQWIKRNIARFGGDPDNVTIMGQSAGSMSVSLLQVAPPARGLFHRIVAMSGGMFGDVMPMATLVQAQAQGVALQQSLGAASLAAMRGAAADRIINAPVARTPIVIDGRVLTGTPDQQFAAHQQADVPVMLGYTRDEAFRSLGPAPTIAAYDAAVRRLFPATGDAVLRAYPATTDAAAQRAATDVQRDASVGRQMADWAVAQAANGRAPAYIWFFGRTHPYTPGVQFSDHDPATVGAYHSGDIPYWLGTMDSFNLFRSTRTWGPGDRALSARMMGYIVRFAHGQAPSADWAAFNPANPQIMPLDVDGPSAPAGMIDWPHFADLPLLRHAIVAPPVPAATPTAARVRD
ncbi:MAG: carboxylesterase/lipase family protein, partial [Sphingopyxis sp.]